MRDRAHHDPSRAHVPLPRPAPAAPLASALGNQAFGRLLRACRPPVEEPVLRFEVGKDVSATLAAEVKAAVADGAVGDADLDAMHLAALDRDRTVSERERLLMAGLLDPANVEAVQQLSLSHGQVIEIPELSVTDERRARIEALGRQELPPHVAALLGQAQFELLGFGAADPSARFTEADNAAAASIQQLTGSLAPAAANAVAVAQNAGVSIAKLLEGMLAAASDGTEGDIAHAGAVLAIAKAAEHPLYGDIAAGRVKVDEVPASEIPRAGDGTATPFAAYVMISQPGGAKADTLYLPRELKITNAYHCSAVIHELEHARQDRDVGPTGTADAVQVEVAAYRAQAAMLVRRLLAEPDDANQRSMIDISNEWKPLLLAALALESRPDRDRADRLLLQINEMAPLAQVLEPAFVQEHLELDQAALELRLSEYVATAYGFEKGAQTPMDGLRAPARDP